MPEASPMPPLSLLSLQTMREDAPGDFHPASFDEYHGQEALKHKLKLYTKAAFMRGEPLDHLLLFGPPGLGKTTLAQIIAAEMNVGIKICSGPMLERTGDLVALLSGLQPREIFFIDEIHRLPIAVEEVLYSAMEHYRVDIIIGQGAGAQSINLPLHPFTLIGATTKAGLLSAPLRTRFGITERLELYTAHELQEIILHYTRHLQCTVTPDAALCIAKAARGTPRIAKKILRRVRDVAQVTNNNMVELGTALKALSMLGIDEHGLSQQDHHLLRTIANNFNGGPVGIETLASIIGEDAGTIEEVYEPYLMQQGYLERTARGRQIPHKKLPYLKETLLGQKSIFKE